MILKIIMFIGDILGLLGGFVDFRKKFWFICYAFQRSLVTGYYRKSFKEFGAGSRLASGLTLLHPERMKIGEGISILRNSVLEVCSPKGLLEIGNGVSIGEYCHLTAAGKVSIGDGVLFGRFVLITDNSHGNTDTAEALRLPPLERPVIASGDVTIGDNVWLGDKVTVLPGVKIGNNSIIGANSVVTKDIPAYSIAAGNPCRVLKQR